MASPRVTHVPAQPRQRCHTSTSTHGSPGKTRALARCPNPHPRSRYLQDPASYARPQSLGPSPVSHSPLLRPLTPQPPPPRPPDQQPPPRPHPALHPPGRGGQLPNVPPNPSPPRATPPPPRPKPRQGPHPRPSRNPRPLPNSHPNPSARHDRNPQPSPNPSPKPGATTAARVQPPEDVLYDIRPQPSQARRQQHPAWRPPTVTNAAATTFIAERAAAKARRTSSRHLSKPAPQARGPPQTSPDQRQGPPAASRPPYQPSMTAHIKRMPCYRRRRESPPNPEAETVRAHPRVRIRARPHSPHTPTEQDYEESPKTRHRHRSPRPRHTHARPLLRPRPRPRLGTVVAALDPHGALGAAKVGPGRAVPRGPGPPAPQGVGGELPPPASGGSDAAGRMGSHAG